MRSVSRAQSNAVSTTRRSFLISFATGCHQLRPVGSIDAPSGDGWESGRASRRLDGVEAPFARNAFELGGAAVAERDSRPWCCSRRPGSRSSKERLKAPQEADACGLGSGVEVAGQDHVHRPLADDRLDRLNGRGGLQLALELVLRLPRRQVVDEQDLADAVRYVNLCDERRRRKVRRARCELLVELAHSEQWPAARDRRAVAVVEKAGCLVVNVVVGIEDLGDGVVLGCLKPPGKR
jgi:hypothetical protein